MEDEASQPSKQDMDTLIVTFLLLQYRKMWLVWFM